MKEKQVKTVDRKSIEDVEKLAKELAKITKQDKHRLLGFIEGLMFRR